MTDPIADMLTRIRNAVIAHHSSVRMPSSRIKHGIAGILQAEGFVENVHLEEEGPRSTLCIDLKWLNGQSAIEGVRRISTPGRRQYARSTDIPKVRNGLGIMIVSTSHGLMTDRAARKAGVGGELICSVW
jgi:small subunit ribosomal protein S8